MLKEMWQTFKDASKEDWQIAGFLMMAGVGISCIIVAIVFIMVYIYGGF